jgi:hypothetical protein
MNACGESGFVIFIAKFGMFAKMQKFETFEENAKFVCKFHIYCVKILKTKVNLKIFD